MEAVKRISPVGKLAADLSFSQVGTHTLLCVSWSRTFTKVLDNGGFLFPEAQEKGFSLQLLHCCAGPCGPGTPGMGLDPWGSCCPHSAEQDVPWLWFCWVSSGPGSFT